MSGPQLLQTLYSLGLEFWLPLPLLGLAFWWGGGLLTDRMLSRSYDPMIQLQADTQMEGQPPKTVISINVEIKRRQGFQSQSQDSQFSAQRAGI